MLTPKPTGLLPCPCCGSARSQIVEVPKPDDLYFKRVCQDCGIQTQAHFLAKYADESWNRRAPASTAGEVNRLRAEGMMDASWLIWEKVIETAAGIRAIKASRAIIEDEAKKLWPEVKLPWERVSLSTPNPENTHS